MLAPYLVLGTDTDAIPRARRFTTQSLAGVAEGVVDDAELIVAELVTNALLHGRPPVTLRLLPLPDRVRIEVEDRGRQAPVRPRQTTDAMTGRGLFLVAALATGWGVAQAPRGKIVWAELATSADGIAGTSPGPDAALVVPWEDVRDPDVPLYTVRLGAVPTDLLLEAKSHIDNIVRELTLAGASETGVPQFPGQVANLVETVTQGFASARAEIKRQAIAAYERRDRETELVLVQPASAADAGELYLEALDEADRFARAARLLTLETPPVHRAFRRWYVQSLVDQIRAQAEGRAAPRPRTFQAVLADEVTRLAALADSWDRLQLLQKVTGELTGAETVQEIAGAVARNTAQFLGAAAVRVAVLGADRILRTVAVEGSAAPADPDLVPPVSADADHPDAVVVRTGAALLLHNRAQIRRRFPGLDGIEAAEHALHVAPLTVGGHRLGVISIAFPAGSDFDASTQVEFVTALADTLAQALERAIALEQAARANAQLSQANDRLAFLARTSAVLAESLDFEQTRAAVATLLVPGIADWCRVELLRPPVGPEVPGAVARIVRGGRSELYAEASDDDLAAVAADPESAKALQERGIRSVLVLPLAGRTGVIGALTIACAESGRHYTAADVPFAEDVARRAALAVETAETLLDRSDQLADATERAAAARAGRVAPSLEGDSLVVLPLPERDAQPKPRIEPGVWFRALYDNPLMLGAVADLDGWVLDATRSAVEAVGFTPDQVVGRQFWDGPWWKDDEAARLRARHWCETAASGAIVRDETEWWDGDGAQHWVDVAVHPVADEAGEIRYLSLSGLDVTARVAAQKASTALGEAAERDLRDVADQRATTIVQLEVTQAQLDRALQLSRHILDNVADGIYGLDHELRATFANPSAAALVGYPVEQMLGRDMHQLLHRRGDGRGTPREQCAAVQALQSGRIVRTEVEWYRRADATLIPVETVAVPTVDAGVVTGVVISFRDISERIFAEQRAEQFRGLEARAAVQRELAHQVQQALLTEPPVLPGLEVAVRYSAASRDAQIGGDWYDVLDQPDGSVLVVVGDVLGHDTSAAAAMAQLRGLLRGIAIDLSASPGEILTRFEDAAARHRINTLATCALGRLDPPGPDGCRRLVWSNAGHLPPVVRRADGSVAALRTIPDLLLGLQPGTRQDHEAVLGPGDLLVLYTDGLIERRGEDIDTGIEALQLALAGLDGPVDEVSDMLLARMLPDEVEDDVALLAVYCC